MARETWIVVAALAACKQDFELIGEPPDVDPGDVTECGFTRIEGTDFSRYDCNPVFESTGEDWSGQVGSIGFHATDVVGHPFYQMWYTAEGTDGSNYKMGYAVSGDGTNWDTHTGNPLLSSQTGAWDEDIMDGLQVVWDPTGRQYVMTYQGAKLGDPNDPFDAGIWGMGVATSGDGVTWAKHPANPVIDFNDPFVSATHQMCWPMALSAGAGGGFVSYVAASDPLGGLFGDPRCDIYAATGSLSDWTISSVPALAGGSSYDAAGYTSASVAELDGVQYMFFIGFETWTPAGGNVITATGSNVGLATSTNGTTWVKSPENPLPLKFEVPGEEVRAIRAQTVGTRIHLWISDYYEDIGEHAVGYFLFEPGSAAAE
jgi:hypothetical protein